MHVIQQKLLRLADSYNLGVMPLRDIAKLINHDHPQLIKHHLESLEKKGFIEWDREKKIIKRVTNEPTINIDFIIVPVVGAANCGRADIYAEQYIEEHIKVSNSIIRNRRNVFAVKAVGSSMNQANIGGKNIEENDYVLIDHNDKDIQTNDYVLSVIDGMANIKKIIIDHLHSQIALVSESTFNYPTIYLENTEELNYFFNGKVIQVIKALRY